MPRPSQTQNTWLQMISSAASGTNTHDYKRLRRNLGGRGCKKHDRKWTQWCLGRRQCNESNDTLCWQNLSCDNRNPWVTFVQSEPAFNVRPLPAACCKHAANNSESIVKKNARPDTDTSLNDCTWFERFPGHHGCKAHKCTWFERFLGRRRHDTLNCNWAQNLLLLRKRSANDYKRFG